MRFEAVEVFVADVFDNGRFRTKCLPAILWADPFPPVHLLFVVGPVVSRDEQSFRLMTILERTYVWSKVMENMSSALFVNECCVPIANHTTYFQTMRSCIFAQSSSV